MVADLSFRRTELKKRRQFRKFTYRGIDLDQYVRLFYLARLVVPSIPSSNERHHKILFSDLDATAG